MRYKILRNGELDGHVLLDNSPHGVLTDCMLLSKSGYEATTWASRAPRAEKALNRFFLPVGDTRIPIAFVHADLARNLVIEQLELSGAVIRPKGRNGIGYMVEHPTDIQQIDKELVQAARICDAAITAGHSITENPFLYPGYSPGMASVIRSQTRAITRNDEEPNYSADSFRYFSVSRATKAPPRTNDPHLFDRVDRALEKNCNDVVMVYAQKTQGALISRVSEAVEVTFRSLTLGAQLIGATSFGRLLVIKDKPTGSDLVKPAVMTKDHEPVFYGEWIDGERRERDPRGWGVADYERECFAGNPEALSAAVFITKKGVPLLYDNARRRMFEPAVKKARIMFQGKPVTMGLRRHEGVNRLLDFIEALDVPRYVKEAMKRDVQELLQWKSPISIKAYSAFHERMQTYRRMAELQDATTASTGSAQIPQYVLDEQEDDVLSAAFRDWE